MVFVVCNVFFHRFCSLLGDFGGRVRYIPHSHRAIGMQELTFDTCNIVALASVFLVSKLSLTSCSGAINRWKFMDLLAFARSGLRVSCFRALLGQRE